MKTDWRENIRAAITGKGYSLRQVSCDIGHAPDYLKRALRKDGPAPSVETIIKISNLISVPVASLLDGLPLTSDTVKFIEKFNDLTPAQQVAVAQLLASFDQPAQQ